MNKWKIEEKQYFWNHLTCRKSYFQEIISSTKTFTVEIEAFLKETIQVVFLLLVNDHFFSHVLFNLKLINASLI